MVLGRARLPKALRNEIKRILADHLEGGATADGLSVLEPADIWCAKVLTWKDLVRHEGFRVLRMTQEVDLPDGGKLTTTRNPIRIDGKISTSRRGAPRIGGDQDTIAAEFFS